MWYDRVLNVGQTQKLEFRSRKHIQIQNTDLYIHNQLMGVKYSTDPQIRYQIRDPTTYVVLICAQSMLSWTLLVNNEWDKVMILMRHGDVFSGGSRIFRWGGALTCWGAPTSDTYAFWWKHMRKWKNWILLGARAGSTPPGSANGLAHNICQTLNSKQYRKVEIFPSLLNHQNRKVRIKRLHTIQLQYLVT